MQHVVGVGYNWLVAKCATGSGVACSVRQQLCNMYIALVYGIHCTGGSFDVRHR